MAALMGGFAGQEVLKCVSGKFSPLNQLFYFDAVETLPSEGLPCVCMCMGYGVVVVVSGVVYDEVLFLTCFFLSLFLPSSHTPPLFFSNVSPQTSTGLSSALRILATMTKLR